ncbi:MAG: isochorismatase family protein [Bryobacterales bacterium]|nr:isochorismatase family protein [Bryobacterales bacterium]MBV9397603.1 isochorismatase family protein [Bryobacterales bacterium]
MPKLNAKPEPIDIDFTKSAVVVVDMQNAFASERGLLDLAGMDISGAPQVIRCVKRVIDAARQRSMPVVFLQMGYQPDLSDGGGPESPNWHKELAIRMMNCDSALKGKLVTVGGWDFEIVDELKPRPEDLVIVKTRYSGFARTSLDDELRKRGIRYLFFTGIATNVCVESTLRDAFFLDYWPILIADAAMATDEASHEASVRNVERFFGWTIPSSELVGQLATPALAR